MSHKSGKIAALIENLPTHGWDRHYVGFFDCFNRGLYYEAHDVLEELWLPSRGGAKDSYYKGLIQLAGAFVHFQKSRLRPAGALLRLAQANLQSYPGFYDGVSLVAILELIEDWLRRLEDCSPGENPFLGATPPILGLPEPRKVE